MANAKEIRERMNSVRDTAKITNAMYLISSTKMQKAKRSLEAARPYFETIHSKIENIFKDADDVENSRYFVKEGSDIKLTGNIACLFQNVESNAGITAGELSDCRQCFFITFKILSAKSPFFI